MEVIGLFRKRAVLQDAIHGSVPINEFEYQLLQTMPLRRLHGIKQLGFLHLVYPSATHSRLSHSVGVMHIAGLLAERAARQVMSDASLCGEVAEKCNWDSMRILIQLARLAGLLHDIGHLPYSHATEDVINKEGHYGGSMLTISKLYEEEIIKLASNGKHLKIHELLGYKIALELAEPSLLDEEKALLVEAAVKSIWFPEKAEAVLGELGLRGGAAYIIRDLITHDVVDADRLDYLRRDAWHTGVIYGFTDLDRIYSGVRVKLTEGKPEIYYDISAQQSIEDVYDSRYKMYKIVYYHHKATALLISYWNAFTGLARHWHAVAPREVSDYDLEEDLLNPRRLPSLVVHNEVVFDDVTIDSALKAAALSNIKIDDATRRWSKALITNRKLLPISLIKRQDEIIAILTKKGKAKSIEEQVSILKEVVNILLTSMKGYVEEAIAREASMNGVPKDEVKVEIVQRSIDSGGMKRGVISSIYLTTINYLSSVGFAQAYTYAENEEHHKKLYKIRKYLRKRFSRILEDIYDCVGSGKCQAPRLQA